MWWYELICLGAGALPFRGRAPGAGWVVGGVGALLVAVVLCAEPARAGVGVSPSLVELGVAPGKSADGVFRVRNDGDVGQRIKVQPEPWPPGVKERALEGWLEVSPSELELGPGQEGVVRYTVRVPVSEEGELGAQIYFASSISQGGALPMVQRYGCAMYVRIDGTERYDLRFSSVTAHRHEKEKQTAFEIVLENRGNVHVRPEAELEVATSTGTAVVVLEGQSPIYAGTHRTFYARLKGDVQVLERGQGVIRIKFKTADGERTVSDVFTLE